MLNKLKSWFRSFGQGSIKNTEPETSTIPANKEPTAEDVASHMTPEQIFAIEAMLMKEMVLEQNNRNHDLINSWTTVLAAIIMKFGEVSLSPELLNLARGIKVNIETDPDGTCHFSLVSPTENANEPVNMLGH